MNILIPTHHFTDDPLSGIETGFWNFSKHLSEKGHKVFVIATSCRLKGETKKSLKEKNIYLYQIYDYKTHGFGPTESFLTFLFAIFLRIFYKFDWIFIIDESKTPFSSFKLGAKLASRILRADSEDFKNIFNSGEWLYDRERKDVGEGWDKRKAPFIYRILRFISIRIWFKVFPINRAGQNSDILFCEGHKPLKYCRKIKRTNPVYLPLGIENYRFDIFNEDFIDTENKFVYLFIGRILRMKGIYNLIKAFKNLAIKYPDIELWVIGHSYGEYADKLRNDIKGFEGKIKILGEKNREDVVRYMKSSHVVVDPMIWANFSSVALEALYCGKPLIAPILGNCKDFIEDGESGFLLDSRNIEKLIDRMEYFYNNYEESKKMGLKGQRFVKKYLTWNKVAKIVEDNFSFFDDKEKIKDINTRYENYNYS